MTLFDAPTTFNDTQDLYRQCLELQWAKDCKALMLQRQPPPWLESDNMLDRDELAILTIIADAGLCGWGSRADNRALADKMGFVAVGNLKAAVGKCLSRGLVRACIMSNQGVLIMTEYGRWVLDIVEDDEGYE